MAQFKAMGTVRREPATRIPVMASPTVDSKAMNSHIAVVDALARELRLPAERVAGAYFQEVARLEENARIKTFVSVLAVGAVRAELRHRGSGNA
jgi:hypothetical protein